MIDATEAEWSIGLTPFCKNEVLRGQVGLQIINVSNIPRLSRWSCSTEAPASPPTAAVALGRMPQVQHRHGGDGTEDEALGSAGRGSGEGGRGRG